MSNFTEATQKKRPEIETEILKLWQEIDVFGKGTEKNTNGEPFVFRNIIAILLSF